MSLTVAEVKPHLNIGHDADDLLLEGYIAAATIHAENKTGRDFAAEYPDDLPAPIRVAVMMHVSTLYEHRETATDASQVSVPGGYDDLLSAYRNFHSGDDDE